MIDSFYVGAYWGSRKETLNEVAEKTTIMLARLSELNSHYSTWYELGMSRKNALEKKVLNNTEYIKKLYQQNIRKGEIDSLGYTTHSFSLGLWTGHADYESSSISLSAGGVFNSKGISNRCVIKIPYEGEMRDCLLKFEKAMSLINILIEIWNPDYALFSSHYLADKINGVNGIGWITYNRNFKKQPIFKDKFIFEKKNNGQLIYLSTLKEEIYDYSLIDQLLHLNEAIR